MKCCIIGYGWLGKPLAHELKRAGYDVIGSVRSKEAFNELKSELNSFIYDGKEFDLIPATAQNADWLIICFPPSKSDDYGQQVADLIAQTSTQTRILFTSTTGVYENQVQVTENGSVMSDHKVYVAEQRVVGSGHLYIILRLAGLIGGERHPVNQLSGKNLDNGNHHVNLIERSDVINAIRQIIDSDHTNDIFNLCFPDHPARSSYYTELAKRRNLTPPSFEPGEGNGKYIDGSKIEKVLNFRYNEPIW